MSGKGDTDPSGESSDGGSPDSGKEPEEPMTPEGEEAGQNEAREKDNKDQAVGREGKSHICASGHCCGRRNVRRGIINRYFGNN